jgi:hypothetical protein
MVTAHETRGSLCTPFLSVLPVAGAAISVLAGVSGQSTMCSSDPTAARLDELQFDLGEGPCWDAMSTRTPVLRPDFLRSDARAWPMFTNAVHGDPRTAEVQAIFAFPLFVGSLDIGAVDLYSTSSAPLQTHQVTDAAELASVAAWQVLRRILSDTPTDDAPGPATFHRREVHQATGMVLAQLDISAEDAALLLRAHAFASGRTVAEVANDVVERRLNFAADSSS